MELHGLWKDCSESGLLQYASGLLTLLELRLLVFAGRRFEGIFDSVHFDNNSMLRLKIDELFFEGGNSYKDRIGNKILNQFTHHFILSQQ